MDDRAGWRDLRRPAGPRAGPAPFGRLAATHALAMAGDTLVTLAMAGSLFFSISPTEARGRVTLSLVLTMAPFAVVGPVLGPAIDRSRQGERAMIVLTCAGRVAGCLFMVDVLQSLLLFPAAFSVLVLSKAYAVAKSALVPAVVRGEAALVEANAKLSITGVVAGFAAALPGVALLQLADARWVLRLAAVVFVVAAASGFRLPAAAGREGRRARPGLGRAAGAGAGPEAGRRGGGGAAGADAGPEAGRRGGRGATAGAHGDDALGHRRPAGAGTGGGHDGHGGPGGHPALRLAAAAAAMALLRAVVGFLTFLVAFGFRREGAPSWWFGVVLAASMAGGLAAAAAAPRVRQVVAEERILVGCLALVALAGVAFARLEGGLWAACVALVTGLAAATAKLAFDALVQHRAPDTVRGASFARFETGFQLVWVVGALLPVVVPTPLRQGYDVIGIATLAAAAAYVAALRKLGAAG